MDEMNVWKTGSRIYVGLGFSHLGFLIAGVGCDPQKAPLRFPLVPLVCSKTFPVGFAQDTGKPAANAKLRQRLECIMEYVIYKAECLCVCLFVCE